MGEKVAWNKDTNVNKPKRKRVRSARKPRIIIDAAALTSQQQNLRSKETSANTSFKDIPSNAEVSY